MIFILRVTLINKGVWGTICDDNFGPEEGTVACRMLGFENSQAILHSHGTFLPGTGPIWIDDIQCIGTELNLKDCITANTWQHSYNCKHLEDVNIECIPLNFNVRIQEDSVPNMTNSR